MLTNRQWTKTNPKTSLEQSGKLPHPPGIHTNLFTKFHDDWAKNVTFRTARQPASPPASPPPFANLITSFFLRKTCHVIQLTGTIFQLISRIKETNVLTKFYENWAKNVTSRVFTCFHYIHIEKNALPTGGHVFSTIWTIFELFRHINKTNVLINFHDWTKIVTSRVFTRKTAQPTGGNLHEDWALNVTSTVFKFDRDIIGTNLLTKFHKDQTINTGHKSSTKQQETKVLTKFHENWAKNVTSRVENAPPTGGHVFSPIWTIFELVREINKTNENCPAQRTGTTFKLDQHIIKTNILTNFELDRDFIGTKLLTKFHEDWTINVAS
ncbi:hypothetical protein DPMN_136706 [Dreissena polymorpha]|uniref:Uncharacterized protein n=1 Tax=Dreissena polymorpha TaxID=45954 RepID=A0A9D4JGZ3_DREPO|nr:hypothetical protein DPMN_136706 [Dreissena polymorpha]